MLHTIFGITAGVLSLFSYGLYVYTIWFGDTRPSRSSWWMLTLVWSVLFLSSISLDSGASDWHTYLDRGLAISYIAGSFIIAVSTLWRGGKEPWRKFDFLCLFFVIVALVLYFIFNAPLWSLIMGIVADIFAIIPTIENAWKHPKDEDLNAWILVCAASLIGLGATNWTFSKESMSILLPTFYLILVDGIITWLIWRGQRRKIISK